MSRKLRDSIKKIIAHAIALPTAIPKLPWTIPPRNPSGTKTAATVANLLRIFKPLNNSSESPNPLIWNSSFY